MHQRLEIKEGQREEDVRRNFDREWEVDMWRAPGQPAPEPKPVIEGAPSWWHGDEDASQSFLSSYGGAA
jgi:hypothetical protein